MSQFSYNKSPHLAKRTFVMTILYIRDIRSLALVTASPTHALPAISHLPEYLLFSRLPRSRAELKNSASEFLRSAVDYL